MSWKEKIENQRGERGSLKPDVSDVANQIAQMAEQSYDIAALREMGIDTSDLQNQQEIMQDRVTQERGRLGFAENIAVEREASAKINQR
ncbi:MAG: hypothetical protein EAY65_04960 [Alphaproteobacteria bacterium]|nr:MAG: hypothetical protein EAY65_04960 [Alphaproteobacteria bacterium]